MSPGPVPLPPAVHDHAVDRVVKAAQALRVIELDGSFETPQWWEAMGVLRDAVDHLSNLDRLFGAEATA